MRRPPLTTAAAAGLAVVALLGAAYRASPAPDAARPNDNVAAAGRLAGGVLTVQLVARPATWYPETERGPGIPIYAFAEEGKSAQVPGPLIRVRAGTEVRATVRNALPQPLRLRGLEDHQSVLDTIDVAPGATRELRFRADAPGTYLYWGRTEGNRLGASRTVDAQLVGAFIVDPAGAAPPRSPGRARDRVMVLTGRRDSAGLPPRDRHVEETFAVNGLAWPHSERLHHAVGDSVRWRVINASSAPHPMHLHGFYFRVDSRGDTNRDTVFGARQRRTAVTELMLPLTTMAMMWVPTRPGNWLFHCHLVGHINAELRLTPRAHGDGHPVNHAIDGMSGLVSGIHVRPARGVDFAAEPAARRRLRLFVNQRPRIFGERPGYSFVLQEGPAAPAPDSMLFPSSTITLQRGEPVAIMVKNQADEHVSVHWHGIELESYFDGVSDWSGWKSRTAPAIAPGDSFEVRMTPDRAGTFIYHTHANEVVQLGSGLYGALIVLEPGARPDPHERILLLGGGGPVRTAPTFLNGTASPRPLELTAGVTHRLRFINISTFGTLRIRLLADTTLQSWRAFAKDGADLPEAQAAVRPSVVLLGPGETYDFEVTRDAPGELDLEVTTNRRSPLPPLVMRVPVRVASGSSPAKSP